MLSTVKVHFRQTSGSILPFNHPELRHETACLAVRDGLAVSVVITDRTAATTHEFERSKELLEQFIKLFVNGTAVKPPKLSYIEHQVSFEFSIILEVDPKWFFEKFSKLPAGFAAEECGASSVHLHLTATRAYHEKTGGAEYIISELEQLKLFINRVEGVLAFELNPIF